jgi:hypothetical protein
LDLQRIKLSNNNASHDKEAMSSQPPELPPPRISDKSFKMPSVDTYVEPSSAAVRSKKNEESFADFTQFPDSSSKVCILFTNVEAGADKMCVLSLF